jgi:hypothetical protein
MAREEEDREDILREATALVDRIELRCPWCDEPLVAGFRREGALSLFVGQDEVYQFTARGALRRAYWQGKLVKAERGRLVQLTRQRSDTQTLLVRHELSPSEQDAQLQRLTTRLERLRDSLRDGDFQVVGEVSGSGHGVVDQLRDWLDRVTLPPPVAQAAGLD